MNTEIHYRGMDGLNWDYDSELAHTYSWRKRLAGRLLGWSAAFLAVTITLLVLFGVVGVLVLSTGALVGVATIGFPLVLILAGLSLIFGRGPTTH